MKPALLCGVAIVTLAPAATADVFNMGEGLTSLEFVRVGDPGNPPDTRYNPFVFGAVDYVYLIGKYEVTNAQYCEFLNSVADADPNGLYDLNMGGGWHDIGGISRIGDPGGYEYAVRENRGNRPVNYVSFYDALRFANWLHNGQPIGRQGPGTTEDGAYDMSLNSSVVRKPGALVFLPSEDEWYKAAYYKGDGTNAGYWTYPTESDTCPTAELPSGADMINGSANHYGGDFVDTTYYTTEVGAYNATDALSEYVSDSAYGSFDQGGNLWEWNEADIFPNRGLRGGSFFATGYTGGSLLAAFRYHLLPPSREHLYVGFRVASIPEPGSVALLLSAALALAAYTRRRRPTA